MTGGSWLIAIAGLLTAISPVVVVLIGRRAAKKDPILRVDAELAIAARNNNLLDVVNGRLGEDVARLTQQVSRLEQRDEARVEQIKEHERQIGELQSGLAQVRTKLSEAGRFIESLLRQWGRSDQPPAVPTNLQDLIDPTLVDD